MPRAEKRASSVPRGNPAKKRRGESLVGGAFLIILLGGVVLAIHNNWPTEPATSGQATQSSNSQTNNNRVADDRGQSSTKAAKWQYVPYPDDDGTRLAYDVNSIVVTIDEKEERLNADVTARVVAGDASIVGKYMVLSFDCAGHYRINRSYPLPLSSSSPTERWVGNIACGVARCEMWRRVQGKPVCTDASWGPYLSTNP
jgi:hypothetical protein